MKYALLAMALLATQFGFAKGTGTFYKFSQTRLVDRSYCVIMGHERDYKRNASGMFNGYQWPQVVIYVEGDGCQASPVQSLLNKVIEDGTEVFINSSDISTLSTPAMRIERIVRQRTGIDNVQMISRANFEKALRQAIRDSK